MEPRASRSTPQQDFPDTSVRVILDTDPGIDDALAVLLALSSPEIQADGLTIVYGNCSMEQAVMNALSVLELVGFPQIPVYAGADRHIIEPLQLAESSNFTMTHSQTYDAHHF